ncbi:MAG: hypothetical protein GTN81_05050 [Proteobacteria bacterium]|nr:hypothetical protein [Pseudomonadota bacterium]
MDRLEAPKPNSALLIRIGFQYGNRNYKNVILGQLNRVSKLVIELMNRTTQVRTRPP